MKINQDYLKEQKKRRERINNYLKALVEKGIIKRFYMDTWEYWSYVPFIELNNGKKIALAKSYLYKGSLGIKTIYNYENMTYAILKIKDTMDNEYFK